MNKEILVDAIGFTTRVAVVEDGTPVELYVDQEGSERLVGNIYLGKVQNVLPGMQAAFVDIGLEKNAFLYAGDVFFPGDQFDKLEQIPQSRKINDLLKAGQTIMVQVAKDPIGTKGARVTTHITLAGRSLVLMPTVDYVGVSHRIEREEERNRLKKILHEIKPKDRGVIVRTASAGKSKEAFSEDLDGLMKLYADIEKKAGRSKAPKLLHAEQSLLFRTVRDILMKDVDRLFVNEKKAYNELRDIAEVIAPKLKPRILFKDSENLFDRYETESKIERALERKVWLKNGGYLIIDRTEALTIIDVNTGKFVGKDNLEKTLTATNCEAAQEIAVQLRLRDIGGIIVVDFIDMEKESNRQLVLQTLKNAMKDDHTRSHVYGFTHLGLVELARKKTGRSIGDTLQTTCPYCAGDSKVLSPQSVFAKVRKQVLQVQRGSKIKRMYIEVNPEVMRTMEMLQKKHGEIFPELPEAGYYVRANEALHIEKFTVRPLPDKKVAEFRKVCKIMR
ncbi:MAG: Rne/Rng family ribonuclease [Clostridia bacterium]|nr:Rne/Rng family ribonuclease [Clostridia bacterium]